MTARLPNRDFPPNPPEKPGYVLEFADAFDGEALDTEKWLPYYLPHMLNIYEVPVEGPLTPADRTYPKTFAVDYVRGYRPAGGYGGPKRGQS